MNGLYFEIDKPSVMRKELRKYILRKSYLAYPRIEKAFRNYVKTTILGVWIHDTKFVEWILSEEGLGFLGWKSGFAREQINKMIEEMKRDVIITTGKDSAGKYLEYKLSNRYYLESVLRTVVERTSIDSGKKYKFLEEWYTWITNGERAGESRFRVIYEIGRGVSGLASMGDEGDGAFQFGKENIAPKITPPLVEVWNTKKKEIKRSVEIIIQDEMRKVLNEQS